jgi:hypothetical protein
LGFSKRGLEVFYLRHIYFYVPVLSVISAYPGVFSAIRAYSLLSGRIFGYPGVFSAIRAYFRPSGRIFGYPGVFSAIRAYFRPSGRIFPPSYVYILDTFFISEERYNFTVIRKGGYTLSISKLLDYSNVKKVRSPNLQLQGLIAAQRRLLSTHPSVPLISSNQSSLQAGIGGEDRVANELSKHTFSMENFIFHDLSLYYYSKYQMDTFFLTRYYAIIFEVKNLAGTLCFLDNPPQLIQKKDNGEINGYDSPAAQVERYGELMTLWFGSRKISLPIYRVVVLAYPKQKVERPPSKTKILFPSLISSYIRNIPLDKIWLDNETFNWLSSELVNSHQFYIPAPICETFNISTNDVRTGVLCKTCGQLGMKKTIRSWKCIHCGSQDHLAHLPAIKDWFLIMGSKMTNTDCREFLHVDRRTATRILASMELLSEGTFKNRTYLMDFEGLLRTSKLLEL